MAHKDEKKKKRADKKREHLGLFVYDERDVSREKRRAKDLRNSSWWRKKRATGVCYYCGKKFQPDELTMDHLIPLSRGGKSERFNLVPACKDCNNKKKYLLPAEWEEYLETIKNTKV